MAEGDLPQTVPYVTDWRPIQYAPSLSLFASWDRLQLPPATLSWVTERKWPPSHGASTDRQESLSAHTFAIHSWLFVTIPYKINSDLGIVILTQGTRCLHLSDKFKWLEESTITTPAVLEATKSWNWIQLNLIQVYFLWDRQRTLFFHFLLYWSIYINMPRMTNLPIDSENSFHLGGKEAH